MNFRTQSFCLVLVLPGLISFSLAQWSSTQDLFDVIDYQNGRPRRQLQFPDADEDTNTANLDHVSILGPIKLRDSLGAAHPVQPRVTDTRRVGTVVTTKTPVSSIRSTKTVLIPIPEISSSVTVSTSRRSQVPFQPSTVTRVVTSLVPTIVTITDTVHVVRDTIITLTATTTIYEAPVTHVQPTVTSTVRLEPETIRLTATSTIYEVPVTHVQPTVTKRETIRLTETTTFTEAPVTSCVQTTVTDTRLEQETLRLTATTTFTEAPVTSTIHVIRTQTVQSPAQTVTLCFDDEEQPQEKTRDAAEGIDSGSPGEISQGVPKLPIEEHDQMEIVNANRMKMGLLPVLTTTVQPTTSQRPLGFSFDPEPVSRPYDDLDNADRPAYSYEPPSHAPGLQYPRREHRGVPNVVATTQSPRFVRAADLRRMLVEEYEDELDRTFDFDQLY